jgi:thiamine kinase-like enzyme
VARIDGALRTQLLDALRGAGLAGAPGLPPAEAFSLEALEGGVDRRSFLASAGAIRWIVRLPAAGRSGANDVAVEADINARAASLGIAPAVVGIDEATGALITQHLGGARPITPEALRCGDGIARAAALLKQLHTIRAAIRPFHPEAFADDYVRGAAAAGRVGNAERGLARELRELARVYGSRYPRIVLCHNDLVASNILDDDGRLWLIDFEYAVTAAPVLDLAGLAAMNGFDRGERWRLAEAYYEGSAVPFSAAELDQVVRLVRLIAYFWALSSGGAAQERGPYDAFARDAAAALADSN